MKLWQLTAHATAMHVSSLSGHSKATSPIIHRRICHLSWMNTICRRDYVVNCRVEPMAFQQTN